MRVLLINANRARELLAVPPIGLAYVAEAAREAGHQVEVLDLMTSRRPVQAVSAAVARLQPEVVGVSVRNLDNIAHQNLTFYLDEVSALIDRLRGSTRAPVVLGGAAISVLGGRVLKHLRADFAVVGEGEESFVHLLQVLEERGDPTVVPNLCFHTGAGIAETPRALCRVLGPSGLERWVRWGPYGRFGATWPIQTKRGCPLGCRYCAYHAVEGHRPRRRDPREVVDEIERVACAVGPRAFELVDSAFNVPLDAALAVCEEIVRRDLGVRLTTASVNPGMVTAELLALMKRAGFNSLMLSPDAASETTLEALGKGFGVAEVARAAALVRESGLRSGWFFMLGGPSETPRTADETMSFVERQLDWPRCLVIVTTGIRVLPGTDLARLAVDQGVLAADDDLVRPRFYFSPEVDEALLLRRVDRAIARHPGVVHTAEQGRSLVSDVRDLSLYLTGMAPPYWRFFPELLRSWPMRQLRSRALPAPS
ncbi:MAG: cobalamin-dependent protein [Thermoanaerobaculaceae bacterium]|jgi:radical SAM superfamily enzyme YgiQ (UPF0313 family)|nr:cobalamin-dependent protein [Thermoanaerobaculaceae bacterium]